MGRKYRAIKEALKLNSVRSVVWIDDTPLRLEMYRQAEKIIKKIEKLETKIANFYSQDQRRYENWFNLTFREQISHQESVQQKYRNLCRFHNRLLAWAEKEGCEAHEVYQRLVDLEAKLLSCDDKGREQIEKFYFELDHFAEIKMKESLADEIFGSNFPFDDDDDELDFTNDQEYQQLLTIQKWDDKKIKKLLADSSTGYDFLSEAFYLGTQYLRPHFILRIWDLAPRPLQVKMAKQFSADTGASLYSMIDDFRSAVEAMSSDQESDAADDESDEEVENCKADFGYAVQKNAKLAKLPLEDDQRLKLLYRQLARKIHPDAQGSNSDGKEQNWMKTTWERLQKSYQEKNLTEMEKIFGLTMLRLKDMQGLSYSEMDQCQAWLREDFRSIERQSKHLVSLPAWGFSTKKNFDGLTKKVNKEIRIACARVEEDIEGLAEFHSYLNQLSKTTRPSRKKKSSRKKKRPKGHLKSQSDEQQRNFFE